MNPNQIMPKSCHFLIRKGIYLILLHLFFVWIAAFLTLDVLFCS